MKMPLELAANFCQIAWVVKDIAAAETFFIETMGIEKFLRMENLSAKDTEGTYLGKPADWVPAAWAAQTGEQIYKAACLTCHAAGVAGAPKLGDKAAWKSRIKTGKAALYASTLKGKNAMPAKGGRADLTDAEVKSAVNYMLAKAK